MCVCVLWAWNGPIWRSLAGLFDHIFHLTGGLNQTCVGDRHETCTCIILNRICPLHNPYYTLRLTNIFFLMTQNTSADSYCSCVYLSENCLYLLFGSRCSYGLDGRGLISGWGKGFFFWLVRLDRLWGPLILLSSGHRGVLSPGVKRVRGIMLTTHLHLLPSSWTSGSYAFCTSSASTPYTGDSFTYYRLFEIYVCIGPNSILQWWFHCFMPCYFTYFFFSPMWASCKLEIIVVSNFVWT